MDPSEELVAQNYTVRRMFETAEGFYTSLGLQPLPDTFWSRSMLEKPRDREVLCHATAWDFWDEQDYRWSMRYHETFLGSGRRPSLYTSQTD